MQGETITRLRAGTATDRYTNEIKDWTDPEELEIDNVAVAPRQSSEDTAAGREGVIIGLTLYAPAGSDIEAVDRVVVRGETYEVDGEIAEWTNPYSSVARGVEINVKRVEG